MNPGRWLIGLCAAVALTGCSGSDGGGAGTTSKTTSTSSSSNTPAKAAPVKNTFEERCRFEAAGAIESVPIGDADVLRVGKIGTLGRSKTAVVMLHQLGPAGMCGWVPYAGWVASKGVLALPVDMCGWGETQCSTKVNNDPTVQVKAVIDWARTELGAKRVVVAGASMGGAVALATAQDAGADAVIDLSGPANWATVADAETAAAKTKIPLLIVCADADIESFPDRLRAAVDGSPASDKRYLTAPGGHGYSTLGDSAVGNPSISAVGKQVFDWITGDYAA